MTVYEKNIALYLRRLFKYVLRFKDQFETTSKNVEYFNQEASDLIFSGLKSPAPFALSRFGYSELRAVLTYLHINKKEHRVKKILNFAKGRNVEPWWHENTLKIITHNAGVFPRNIPLIERYVKETIKDIDQIDVLGSWLGGEKHIKHLMPQTKFMQFHDFYHFLHERPWTSMLENKRVLVIHPFENSIKRQYGIKQLIYPPPYTLPDFELITIKAVQTIAGNNVNEYNDWFDALAYMKNKINSVNFDVAIIGCGAYGMPLALHIKKMGKKAIHLGGNVQILFGIKGSRWENDPNFSWIINEHWIKPSEEESPKGHQSIDSNCYW